MLLENTLNRIPFRLIIILLQGVLFAIGTLGIKFAIGHLMHIRDDVSNFTIISVFISVSFTQ